jgi:hypothetical protein
MNNAPAEDRNKCACGNTANFIKHPPDASRCIVCAIREGDDRRRRALMGEVTWGPWDFDPTNLTLGHTDGYYVDLETMLSSHSILHWIGHLSAKKKRFTPEDLGHFIRALDEVVGLRREDTALDFKAAREARLQQLERKTLSGLAR